MANPIIMMTNKNELSYTSNPIKGDGYYGFADGLHTMSFHVSSFTGKIFVEATLMEQPTADDWFLISLENETDYLEFNGQTKTVGTSFQGNFVYVRVRIDRDYLGDTEYNASQHGMLDKAVLLI